MRKAGTLKWIEGIVDPVMIQDLSAPENTVDTTGGLGNKTWCRSPRSRLTPSVNSSSDTKFWRGDTPRRPPRSRGSRPARETPSLAMGSLNSSRGDSCKIGGPIHTNSTRVVLPVSIKLLTKTEEHTLQLLMSAIWFLHLPMTS